MMSKDQIWLEQVISDHQNLCQKHSKLQGDVFCVETYVPSEETDVKDLTYEREASQR